MIRREEEEGGVVDCVSSCVPRVVGGDPLLPIMIPLSFSPLESLLYIPEHPTLLSIYSPPSPPP